MDGQAGARAADDPVVEAGELSSLGPVRLLDVRPLDMNEADPVPGSVRVPIEEWIEAARRDENSFADSVAWQGRLSALGLSPGLQAVVCDGGEMTEAARVWFILQFFGVSAWVVNGGRAALLASNLPRLAPVSTEMLSIMPDQGRVGLIERSGLRDHLDEVAVLDARTEGEFRGDDLRGNARGGHLPGARLLSHGQLLEGGRLLPPEALRQMILGAGFTPGDALVTHCQGGGRAALAALAAVRAGFSDVRVYYRSFGDWAADETCPIVR